MLLGEFRERRVRRGTGADRAEAAELLLNYLEALDLPPSFQDVRAAVVALDAPATGRAAELVDAPPESRSPSRRAGSAWSSC